VREAKAVVQNGNKDEQVKQYSAEDKIKQGRRAMHLQQQS